jgi:ATP-dependent DNA ligase
MNTPTRQAYQDIDCISVKPSTHPICQLKYDGIWCCAIVNAAKIEYYSRNGQLKRTDQNLAKVESGIYIGELMYGSEWAQHPGRKDKFYCFDILKLGNETYYPYPYELRYLKLVELFNSGCYNPGWVLIDNYPTTEKDKIWAKAVDTLTFEGLVFRNPLDPWGVTLLRAKHEIEEDLIIVDFERGKGRLANTLGALICTRPNEDQIITIGGGLTDELRNQIWASKAQYQNRIITITAKKRFASGLLRHPNFKQFHHDK